MKKKRRDSPIHLLSGEISETGNTISHKIFKICRHRIILASELESIIDSGPAVFMENPHAFIGAMKEAAKAFTKTREKKDKDSWFAANRTKLNMLPMNAPDGEDAAQEEHPIRRGKKLFRSNMPEKRILKVVLDILQRRDTLDIFGQPVDTEAVEDYADFIKEPMHFGTLRAKLHAGMYRTFGEFEA